MDKRAIVFFAVLLGLAAILIFVYKYETDPFKNFQSSQPQEAGHDHNQDVQMAIMLYKNNCTNCHGSFGEGMSGNPRLRDTKLTIDQIKEIIKNGKNTMPAFPDIQEPRLTKLAELITFF
jgi:mono/diheme cytochrome c family protein